MEARDVMTKQVLTIRPETMLGVAVALMADNHISGCPVVDPGGRLVGILTEGDLLHRVETGTGQQHRSKWVEFLLGPGRAATEYVTTHSRRVADLMTEDVVSVGEDTPLQEVVDLMERKHIRRVPVVRAGVLVGVVSRADLVRLLAQKLAALPAATAVSTSDEQMEAAINAELGRQNWTEGTNVRVTARNGAITLEGAIFDPRTRAAVGAAVRNIPGVKDVDDRLEWLDPHYGLGIPGA